MLKSLAEAFNKKPLKNQSIFHGLFIESNQYKSNECHYYTIMQIKVIRLRGQRHCVIRV